MVSFRVALAGFGAVAALLIQPCAALPHSSNISVSQSPNYDSNVFRRADPGDFYLRIMPLGASITAGDYAPKDDVWHSGYRKYLRDRLRFLGWKVNMVGSFNDGEMNDNDHEGVSGHRVSEVDYRAQTAVLNWLPNVVLINAGTNDATQNGRHESVNGTGKRMEALIETVFSRVPDAVVILSTLLPQKDWQHNVDNINEQYRKLYRQYVPLDAEGNEAPRAHVVLADMADGFITIKHINLKEDDHTHPTVEGMKRMASVWDWAINKAHNNGWLKPPSKSGDFEDHEGNKACKKKYGSGNKDSRAGRQVLHAANSVIRDDGTYKHASRPREDRALSKLGRGRPETTKLWFAQLVNVHNAPKGGERDECIYGSVERGDRSNSRVRKIRFRLNQGNGDFSGPDAELDVKDDGCNIQDIQWGDVNGDGLDDFICIAEDGAMFVSLNQGGNPPTFKALGQYKKPEKGLGRAHVRLGDIDGDGRLDYCVIASYGDIFCWRNGGLGEKASYWQNMGSGKPIFIAKGMGDIKGVRLVDINGDGRADWIWMDEKGKVTTYINQRGYDKSMIPRWLSAGVTHAGMGTSIGSDRSGVVFGRIFGDNARADYVHNWEELVKPDDYARSFKPWENLGSGGKYQKGDGIYWGDMTGTGVDDYIWISPEGEANVFLNKNTAKKTDGYATPAWSTPIPLKTGLDRRALHIGDWDGDGKADIIGITDRKTGSLKVWLSRWDGTNFNWEVQDIPDSAKCNQGWGLGYFDHGAYFADITGSGRVDYICMQPNGHTTAWLRDDKGSWYNAGQIKYQEELDRANYRFADVNGDGRADLIWTDKFNGDGKVWYNKGQVPESGRVSGSLFEWERPVKAYLGSSRGPNLYFPNLGGQGRADMVSANPTTGHAWAWFNFCGAGGDDVPEGEAVPDPGLDVYTPTSGMPGLEPGPEDPEDHWFCSKNGGDWDPDLWREQDVGTWFLRRSELYSSPDADWPRDPDIKGIPRIIASYDRREKDGVWNWPGPGCMQITSQCNLNEDHLTGGDGSSTGLARATACAAHPERAFSLWSMRNYALFLQSWHSALTNGIKDASFFTAEFADKFVTYDAPASSSAAAWLTIFAGMFTTVGSVVTGGAAAAANNLGGMLTIAAGAASMGPQEPPKDPRFDTFAETQSTLGNMHKAITNALTAYFDRTMSVTPAQADMDGGTELAKILRDGAFADQDIGITPSTDEMMKRIQASMISGLWNAGNVAIIKWSNKNAFATEWGYSPCYGRPGYKHDHAVACVNDHNYLIARMALPETGNPQRVQIHQFPDVGQDEKTLKKYGLSHQQVIDSAEKTQAMMKSYKSNGVNFISNLAEELARDPETKVLDLLPFFNIPVCDLDLLDSIHMLDRFCTGLNNGWDLEEMHNVCIHRMIAKNCKRLPWLGDERPGETWPYDAYNE